METQVQGWTTTYIPKIAYSKDAIDNRLKWLIIELLLQSLQNALEFSDHHSTFVTIFPGMKYVQWNQNALILQQF